MAATTASSDVIEVSKEPQEEFQLSADPSKYVTLPIQNEAIWRKYQITLDTFWTVYEVNIGRDRLDLINLFDDASQREYILKVIAFMLIAHNTIVTKELFLDLINNVDIKEASYYFASQAESKKTHSMMYSLLLDELIGTDTKGEEDKSEERLTESKAELMKRVSQMPEVRSILRWYVENVNLEQESLSKRMFAFATLQGIVFGAAFMLFNWLEKQFPSKLNGLTKSNSLIWRDEKLNYSFSCMLLEYIDDEFNSDEAESIANQAVILAKNLFLRALPVSKLGMDSQVMGQFLEESAQTLLAELLNSTSNDEEEDHNTHEDGFGFDEAF